MNKTADEEPKAKTAKRVITPKQKYFVPQHGEIEATDLADVEKQVTKLNEQEDGDGDR